MSRRSEGDRAHAPPGSGGWWWGHRSTGSGGYFGHAGWRSCTPQRQNVDPFAEVMARACRQRRQRPGSADMAQGSPVGESAGGKMICSSCASMPRPMASRPESIMRPLAMPWRSSHPPSSSATPQMMPPTAGRMIW